MNNLTGISGVVVTLVDIRWERVFLELDVEVNTGREYPELEFYGVDEHGHAGTGFEITHTGRNLYTLRANITNNGNRECIPEGIYRLYVCCREDILTECFVSKDFASRLADAAGKFPYGNRGKSYNVFFNTEDENGNFLLRIHIRDCTGEEADPSGTGSSENRTGHTQSDFLDGLRSIIRWIYRIFSFFNKHKRKNTILFMSEQSDVPGANLVAVSDRMKERGLDKDYNLKYSAYKRSKAKSWDNIKKQLKELWMLSGCGLIFLDDHAPLFDWMNLDEQQELIQLWHAGAGFKSSGYSRFGHTGSPPPWSCHRQYKYGIAGSEKIAPFFSEAWGINTENVLPAGMPRMDEYLDEEYRVRKTKELYERFPAAVGKKVILFAPTYRGNNNKDAFYPYDLIDLEKLYELCGDEYVVFFKMHPWVIEDIVIEERYADRFFDVKNYPAINDLFYITELLITDYSSSIFEFSLMRRPMLFFAYDEVQYSLSRGFHRPYRESAPGKVVTTFDELLEAIRSKDFEYEKVEEYIEKHFDHIDSHASDRVIDWFILGQMPEEFKERIGEKDSEAAKMRELDFS